MNIEDEEIEREDFQPKVVGRGLAAQFENPEDEQWYLADSGGNVPSCSRMEPCNCRDPHN